MVKVENLKIMSHLEGWIEFVLVSDTQLPIQVVVQNRGDRDDFGRFPKLESRMYYTLVDHGLPLEKEWEELPTDENTAAIEKFIEAMTGLLEEYPHRLGVERYLRQHPELLTRW